MAPVLMDAGIECVPEAGQAFKRHGGDDIRHLRRADGIVAGESAGRGHGTGPVGHAEALLAEKGRDRPDAGTLHRLGAGKHFAVVLCFAKAKDGKGHVGERREVSGGTEGAFLRNDRQHVLIQHIYQDLHEKRPYA